MAKASSLAENLVKELECAVCLEEFKEPKVLPCLHSFCKICLEGLLARQGKAWKLNCPSCRISVEIPEGKVDSLPVNFFLNNLLSLVSLHGDSGSSNLECDNCDSGDPAVKRCTNCCHFLCEFCTQGHRRGRGTSSHVLVSLEEAKKMGSVAVMKPSFCKEHEGELLKLFCETCDMAICRDCTIVKHRDHKYTFVKDAFAKNKESVVKILSETKRKALTLKEAINGVSEMKRSVESHAEQTVQEVINCFQKLTACLNTRCEELLHGIQELKKVKQKSLEIQQEELEAALGGVQSSVEFTETALENGSEVEILNMHKQMSSRLQELNSAKWQLEPRAHDVFKFQDDDKLQHAINNFGKVSSVVTHVACEYSQPSKLQPFCPNTTSGRIAERWLYSQAITHAGTSTVTMGHGSEGAMYNTLCSQPSKFQPIHPNATSGQIAERWLYSQPITHAGTSTVTMGHGSEGAMYNTLCSQPSKFQPIHPNATSGQIAERWLYSQAITHAGMSTVTMGHGSEGVMYNTLCSQPFQLQPFCPNATSGRSAERWLYSQAITHAGTSTVTMGHGSEGVMYNTLCGQSVDFTVTAKERNGRKRQEGGDTCEVIIYTQAGDLAFNDSPKDCGNGMYTFCFTPNNGNMQYQLSVKLNGCHVQGSPFMWFNEIWHLLPSENYGMEGKHSGYIQVDRDATMATYKIMPKPQSLMGIFLGAGNVVGGWDAYDLFMQPPVTRPMSGRKLTVLGSCSFGSGKHSWKVQISGNVSKTFAFGVVARGPCENEWTWMSSIKHQPSSQPQKSSITNCVDSDVIEFYLDLDNLILTMYNQRTKESDTWQNVNGTVCPMFKMCLHGQAVFLACQKKQVKGTMLMF